MKFLRGAIPWTMLIVTAYAQSPWAWAWSIVVLVNTIIAILEHGEVSRGRRA